MIPGLLLWGLLAMPPVAAWLEGSMAGHMLVQIPLLALGGGLVARAAAGGRGAAFTGFNADGIPGLLVAAFAAAVWMLPRMLDAALRTPLVEAAKFITVPLLVGAPVALSWPLLPLVARGFVWANLTSHAAVLGWLYTVAPDRLCTRYLYDQQAAVGAALSVIAVGLLVGWGWWAIAGTATNGVRTNKFGAFVTACAAASAVAHRARRTIRKPHSTSHRRARGPSDNRPRPAARSRAARRRW
jgi:hypothetical protein